MEGAYPDEETRVGAMGVLDAVRSKYRPAFLISLFEHLSTFGEEGIKPFRMFKHLSSKELVQRAGPRELCDDGNRVHQCRVAGVDAT